MLTAKMSNNVTKTDPHTGAEAVPVHNHGQNVENEVSTVAFPRPICLPKHSFLAGPLGISLIRMMASSSRGSVLPHAPIYLTQKAHPGNQASNASYPNNTTQGDKAINTSTSLTGAGGLGTGASGAAVDNSPSALKTPRKTDGSAHSAPGGTLHGGDSHKA